jgi:hypothetical protein
MVREGLSESFVAPALAYLARRHAALRFGQRLVGLDVDGKRATALRFSGGVEHLSRDDVVVLALPPLGASEALPGLTVPTRFTPIVNVHYRLPAAVADPGTPELLGLVGGVAHWLFLRGPVVSVTVSAAEPLVHDDAEAIAQRIWPEIERALGLQGPLPPYRVVKERRATFAQTPEALLARPATRTPLANLVLAGDWTQTGLPATIEGAIRSGFSAARALGAGHRLSSAHGPAVAPREAGRPAAA